MTARFTRCSFNRWDGDRCYVDFSCSGLTIDDHYTVYPIYDDHTVGSWGFRSPWIYWNGSGYMRGDRIDDGDCYIELRLCHDHDPEDYEDDCEVYIPPRVAPVCEQWFEAVNEHTEDPIKDVLFHISSGLWCVTAANGKCKINLTRDREYTVRISHDRYESEREDFIACEEDVFYIPLTPKSCTQKFQVKDIDTDHVIRQAKVRVDGKECYTSVFGSPCSVELLWDVDYVAEASKSGYFQCPRNAPCYETNKCCRKTFRACSGNTITLYLKKKTAKITFASTPDNAEVFVNGTHIGHT